MIFSKMGVATRGQVPLVLVLIAAVCISSIACEQTTTSSFKESVSNDDQLVLGVNRADGLASPLRANSRLLAVPLSLARFMFPHSRPGEHQTQAALMAPGGFGSAGTSNNKRSGSQFDVLTGMSGLGKRSVPVEYINLEPIFRGQNLVRGPSRVHDMRWGPLDAMDAPLMGSDY